MSATWSSPRAGFSKKKKRRPIAEQSSHLPDIYHSSPDRPETLYTDNKMSADRRGPPPSRGSRSDYSYESNAYPDRAYPRGRDRDRDRERSRSPTRRGGAYALGRRDEEDRRRASESNIDANGYEMYRPSYSDAPKPATLDDTRGSSSTHTSISGSPMQSRPDRAALTSRDHLPQSRTRPASEPRLKAVEAPKNSEKPPAASIDYTEAVKALSEAFKKLTEEATDVSALRQQERAARKRYEDRQLEFNRSKDQHEKFPNTEFYQASAKVQAEKNHKSIKDQLDKKNADLNSLAVKAAENLVPSIVSLLGNGVGGKDQQKLQERCDSLEQRLEEQIKFIEDLQKQNKELKEKQSQLESDGQSRHMKFDKEIQAQFREANRNISASNKDVHALKQDVNATQESISQLVSKMDLIPIDLKQSLDKIDSISSRVNDLPANRLEFSKFKQECTDKIKSISEQTSSFCGKLDKLDKLDKLEAVVSGPTGLMESIVILTKQYTDLFKRIEEKIDTESSGTKKDIEALRDELSHIEQKLSILSSDSPTSFQNRVAAVEHAVAPLTEKVKAIEEESRFYFTSSAGDQWAKDIRTDIGAEVAAVQNRLKSVEEGQATTKQIVNLEERLNANEALVSRVATNDSLKVLEDRVLKVEKQTRLTQTPTASPAPSTPSANNIVIPADFSSRLESLAEILQTCRKEVDDIKTGQENLDNSMAEVVDTLVQTATEGFGPRLTAIEDKLSGYDSTISSLSGLPAKMEQFQESQQHSIREQNNEIKTVKDTLVAESASKAIEVIRAEPGLLPDSKLEERLTNNLTIVNNTISQEVLGIHSHVVNLEARMNNINTGTLATFMLDQLGERFPNLQTTEASMNRFRVGLEGVQARTIQIANELKELQLTVQTYETVTQSSLQNQESLTSKAVKDFRKEIDDLAQDNRTTYTMSRKTKETLDTMQELSIKNSENIADRFDAISLELDTLKRQATVPTPARNTASPPVPTSGKAPVPNGNKNASQNLLSRQSRQGSAGSDRNVSISANGPNKGSKPGSFPVSTRQTTLASDTNNKKRKLANGSSTPLKTNGMGSNNSSPRKRARRRSFGQFLDGDDPEEDPDFDLVQPALSSDDEDQ